jgi:ferric iron reductase protein FhuF
VNWTHYKHPTLGDVEIGGFVPYLKITPPPSEIEKTISFHADFYIGLMNRLPELKIKDTQVKALEDGLYQVTVSFTNIGRFPTSTAQGRRTGTSSPIRVHLKMTENQSLFSGRPIEAIPVINENGDIKKLEWTIRGKKGSKITITAKSPKLGSVTTTVVLQ